MTGLLPLPFEADNTLARVCRKQDLVARSIFVMTITKGRSSLIQRSKWESVMSGLGSGVGRGYALAVKAFELEVAALSSSSFAATQTSVQCGCQEVRVLIADLENLAKPGESERNTSRSEYPCMSFHDETLPAA